jgi:hypothetical protein
MTAPSAMVGPPPLRYAGELDVARGNQILATITALASAGTGTS